MVASEMSHQYFDWLPAKLHHESLMQSHVCHTSAPVVTLSLCTRVSLAYHLLMTRAYGIVWAASDVSPSFACPWSVILLTDDHRVYLHPIQYLSTL